MEAKLFNMTLKERAKSAIEALRVAETSALASRIDLDIARSEVTLAYAANRDRVKVADCNADAALAQPLWDALIKAQDVRWDVENKHNRLIVEVRRAEQEAILRATLAQLCGGLDGY